MPKKIAKKHLFVPLDLHCIIGSENAVPWKEERLRSAATCRYVLDYLDRQNSPKLGVDRQRTFIRFVRGIIREIATGWPKDITVWIPTDQPENRFFYKVIFSVGKSRGYIKLDTGGPHYPSHGICERTLNTPSLWQETTLEEVLINWGSFKEGMYPKRKLEALFLHLHHKRRGTDHRADLSQALLPVPETLDFLTSPEIIKYLRLNERATST